MVDISTSSMNRTLVRQAAGSVCATASSMSSRRRNRPASAGTSFCLSSAHQAGWVKSPVATTPMPLRAAQAARCSRSRSRLVAREYFEWTCRSAWKRMRATPSSPDPGGRAAISGDSRSCGKDPCGHRAVLRRAACLLGGVPKIAPGRRQRCLESRRFGAHPADKPRGFWPAGSVGTAFEACLPRMQSSLKIVIVDENPIRAAILEDGLREAGHVNVTRIEDRSGLLARIYAIDPDVILIDLENPSRDVLEQMFQVSRAVKRPIAMFVDQSDTASIQASVDAGVSAYIVDGLKKERIKPILDLCISRFNAFAKLQDELDRTKSALEDRKVIDRAKGILMKVKGLNEEEAYVLLRSTAMREKKKIGEIAQSILTASELLK